MSLARQLLDSAERKRAKRIRAEIWQILRLCWPTCSCSLLLFSLQFVNMLGAGRLGTQPLAAVALANSYFNIVVYFLMGAASAIDTAVSQTFGRGQQAECKVWLVRSLIVFGLASIPFCAILEASHEVFSSIGIAFDVAEPAAAYIHRAVPGTPPLVLFVCLQKYQQAMNIMWPSLFVLALGNILNLVFTLRAVHAGSMLDLAWSLSYVRLFMAVLMSLVVYFTSERQSIIQKPYQEILCKWEPLRWFLGLCFSGAFMQGLEAMAFELTVFAAASQGKVPLDAHNVLLQVISLIYLSMPLGISVAATIRVGNLLGARESEMARVSSFLCICLGSFVMMCSAITIFIFRHNVAYIFTANPSVAKLVASLAPIAACFQSFDGFQGVCGGVLRAMGRQSYLAVSIFVAFYVISTPVGFVLCFHLHWGVAGLWYGLASGLGLMAIAFGLKIFVWIDWDQEVLLAQIEPTNALQDGLLDDGSA